MKYIISFILLVTFKMMVAQAPTAGDLVTTHSATLTEINSITSPCEGSLVYNSDGIVAIFEAYR